jgi:hypothetical protein
MSSEMAMMTDCDCLLPRSNRVVVIETPAFADMLLGSEIANAGVPNGSKDCGLNFFSQGLLLTEERAGTSQTKNCTGAEPSRDPLTHNSVSTSNEPSLKI